MKNVQFDIRSKGKGGTGQVLPLLGYLAGDHAGRLATLWPQPHGDFFVLPTARRHAAAILTSALGERHKLSGESLVRLVERQKDRVIAELIVGPDHSSGFMKALSKLGEVLWQEADYRTLIQLYSEPDASLYIRHLDEIRPHMLATIALLPTALRQSRILNFTRHRAAARDMALAYALIGKICNAEAQTKSAERWGRAQTRDRLFEMVGDDLSADRPVRWTPPPLLPDVFERIETREQLKAAALEFKNCLCDFQEQFGTGRMAVYLWRGTPNAAVALNWNVDGWRLAEAEAADNEALEEGPLREIAETLEGKGVRVGSSINNLRHRLSGYRYEQDGVPMPHHDIPPSFIDSCDLGDLWN